MRTLRVRLLAVLMAMLLVVSTVIGVVTVVALEGFLTNRVDTQLTTAADRITNGPPPRRDAEPPDVPGGLWFLLVPGQGSAALGAWLVDGQVNAAAVLDETGEPQAVSSAANDVLAKVAVDGKPHTVDLEGLGSYRLIAVHAPDGSGTLISGLPLAPVYSTLMQLTWVVVGVTAAGLLAAGIVGAVIVRRTLHPLHRVATTARRVTELRLDRGEVALAERVPAVDTDPRTEVGQVGTALNHMLGHVSAALSARHASEMRVRQFVADASHELRTPLAAIRGYAELTRRGNDEVPADVTYAMRRVESEATRMTSLVEDMLLLARLDAGRPLARDSVDLSRIVVDAVSDARAAGPDHSWRLDVPVEPVVVSGDAHRLHQALANLLGNARTHTPPGTTVLVALSHLPGDGVSLRVVDNGPGIPAALQPTVFERFARGDTSRSRAAGSTGLGLAIVAAVVDAHHGTIELQSRAGFTAFVIHLPDKPVNGHRTSLTMHRRVPAHTQAEDTKQDKTHRHDERSNSSAAPGRDQSASGVDHDHRPPGRPA